MSILNVKNLSVEYISSNSSVEVLKGISIDVHNNEVLGIVGESGSGKSTLIKSIMRILSAPGLITSGEVIFNKHDILKMTDEELSSIRWKEISLVKQKALNSLNPVSKIGHQLALPYRYHLGLSKDESEKKARRLLDLVKIDQSYFNSYPHELSGGMRQRVIIAIALTLEPKLVIMDEPTTALDVITEREIISSIKDLQKELKFSIIFITHDLNLLLEFADKICVLYDGELVDYDSTEKIKNGGTHDYTKILLNAIPKINSSTKSVETDEGLRKILSLNDVNVKYQIGSWTFPAVENIHAIKNINFKLYGKHVTSIIGESGSGKSTIAKAILGLEKLSSGKIINHMEDDQQVKYNLSYRKDVQMIFQDPFSALNPIHTVFHHLQRPLSRFSITNKNNILEKVCELLEMVELSPADKFLNRFPHEMSGGECQRVNIARALCSKPKLIIADEPTSMLDVSIRSDILKLFIKLKENYNTSILLITHDIASASICSDYMIVLKDGNIVEFGDSNKIINQPSHSYTKSLISAAK